MALFLACSMSQEQINKEGLTNVVHIRRNTKGARPGLTCKAITGGPVVRAEDECWLPPNRMPSVSQKRRMIGCLVKSATQLVMKNHYYPFNDTIRHSLRLNAEFVARAWQILGSLVVGVKIIFQVFIIFFICLV